MKPPALSPDWRTQPFDALGVADLYRILQLRAEVFVVEQRCVYQDVDGKDPLAHHVTAWDGDRLAACARLLPPGVSSADASVGRVLTAPAYRGTGLGRALVARCLADCRALYGARPIRIGAQHHLASFYGSFGFVACSDPYVEDGIPHVDMVRPQEPFAR